MPSPPPMPLRPHGSTAAGAPAGRTAPGGNAAAAAAKTRLRRALTLMAMTVVLPGSAQLVAGNRRLGHYAMRAFAVALACCLVVAGLALWWPSELVSVFTRPSVLRLLRVGLVAYAVLWAWLIIDSWRIAEPLALSRRQRLGMTALNGVLCFSLSGALLFSSHLVAVQRDFIVTVFGSGAASSAAAGRYNVLLLGGDAGPKRVGIRPDSITVASIDAETGRTVLFGLPRNLADVPFPAGSAMAERFPDGFDCDGCYLNGVYTWASEHAHLFPHSSHPGVDATSEAVEEITGLKMNYYALIDLKGFQDLVDAVGGVTIDIGKPVPIGSVGRVTDWIDAGHRHLDGYETLWYARSRADSDDYSRMARQKCVMNAMLHQLNPTTVVSNFGAIAKAGKQIISTDIPASELDTFIHLALKAKDKPISTVSFVPPRVNTSDPDYPEIRQLVSGAVAAAESGHKAGPKAHKKHRHKKRDANDSTDLAASC